MNLSIDELETIKKKSFQEGYDEGHKIGFEEGYAQGMDYSDSCLDAHIEELEEELYELKGGVWKLYEKHHSHLATHVIEFGNELKELLDKYKEGGAV